MVLLDTVIGFGAADDPAGALVPVIKDGIARAAEPGVKSPLSHRFAEPAETSRDTRTQRGKLAEAGVTVLPNNAAAVRHALALIAEPASCRASVAQPTPPRIAHLLENGPTVINIGLRTFAETLRALGVSTVQYDWSPAAGGDPRLAGLLRALDHV